MLSVYDGSWQLRTNILPLTLGSSTDNTLILPLTGNFPGEARRFLVLEEGSQPFSGFRISLREFCQPPCLTSGNNVLSASWGSFLVMNEYDSNSWAIEMAQ